MTSSDLRRPKTLGVGSRGTVLSAAIAVTVPSRSEGAPGCVDISCSCGIGAELLLPIEPSSPGVRLRTKLSGFSRAPHPALRGLGRGGVRFF